MIFPPDAMRVVQLYHLPTTAGSSQAYPSAADVTTSAAVLPMDRKELALEGTDYLDPWELYLEDVVDVRLNDKVVLSGDTANYYVRRIFVASFGLLRHKRVTISKQP